MMMANSSPLPPQGLGEETVVALRAALRAYIESPDQHAAELGAALERVAADARQQGMLPESLLVALKDTWYQLPEVHGMSDGPTQVRLLQRVVTMCIKEYYTR